MLALTERQLAENLRCTNARLRGWLENLKPDAAQPMVTNAPQLISELLSELLRAGEWMRQGAAESPDRQVQAELGDYRRNLERLRDHMPAIHSHLLAERARLEAERARIESSVNWAQGSRQIL